MFHFDNYHKTSVISKYVNIFDKVSLLVHDISEIKNHDKIFESSSFEIFFRFENFTNIIESQRRHCSNFYYLLIQNPFTYSYMNTNNFYAHTAINILKRLTEIKLKTDPFYPTLTYTTS